MNGNISEPGSWKRVRDIKIICENNAKITEEKVRTAIKEGWDFQSTIEGCPGSCPNVCILMVDRRLPSGVEII